MSRLSVKKRAVTPVSQSEGLVRRQKAMAAQISQTSGSSRFDSRDPVYHLMNNYINRFDAVGKARAKKMAGDDINSTAERSGATQLSPERRRAQMRREHDSPMYRHTQGALESGEFVDRFSAYAFNGGNMAAAVMAGKGKMMFTSCLSRALGRGIPSSEKEKQLLSATAVRAGVDGTQSDVMFNRHAHSAIGITLDAIRGASSSLEVFKKLANESGSLKDTPVEHRDIDTIPKLFPFMVTKKDKALIDTYKQRLKQLEGDNSQEAARSRKTLEWALKKESAVLARKKAEQRRFLTVLDGMLSNVREAEKIFSADGFAESVLEEIERLSTEEPPDDPNKERQSDIPDVATLLEQFLSGVSNDGARAERSTSEAKQQTAKKPSAGKNRARTASADDDAAGGTGSDRRK